METQKSKPDLCSLSLNDKRRLISHLRSFARAERVERFENILLGRTRYLTIALENIFQSQNASAVLRSCDCLGVQDVHIIEQDFAFASHPDIALGADKWLTLQRYKDPGVDNTRRAIRELREKGYRIVATTPHRDDYVLENLPIDGPLALFFGTELTGLSSAVLEEADAFVKIPMVGFTESFNISVSAAISMYSLTQRIRSSSLPWQLSEEESCDLLLEWLRTSIRMSEGIIDDWKKNILPKKEQDI